ncbi:LysR family transcriptional regulator [Methyloferula stellata]|uniref:LysR family transcriptional regulator n=1 Tax=Methyloferula stellata TaxID=876270 RepID=UPI00039B8A96|nr:LysR family transcriptional regulator [Methyloferula stellata]
MQGPGTPSLDQLKTFLTVVETGSFAAAGRKLGRATSAISYAIANLESQLGVALFDRESTRKPVLTEAGNAVLSEACAVNSGIDHLLAKVRGLLSGLEAEVALAVDIMLPTERLVDAMRAFEAEFPTVSLRLHVEALGAVTQLVRDGVATIGISGPLDVRIAEIETSQIGGVELVPVAAPSHPLAQNRINVPGAAREHVQLVLSDRSSLTEGRDFGVIATRSWRMADLSTKHALLLAGIGWGNMPEPMVREDLAAGRLTRLDIPEWRGGAYVFQAIHRTDTPPGPAAAWLIKRFSGQSA